MESISYLTYLGVVVLLGLACSVISKKIAVPNILLLIFTGIFLNKFWDIINGGVFFFQKLGFIKSYTPYLSGPLIFFPPLFIAILALLALVMIVFESTSKFKYKDLDDFSLSALKLTIVFFAVNFAILSILTNLLFGLENIFLAGLFAALMSGTASDVVMSMIKETKNEVIKLLEIESIFNTPLIVIIPFLILELISNIGFLSSSIIISKLIEIEINKLLDGSNSFEDFITNFREDDDLIKKRKEARELLNLNENENNLEVIDKQFKNMAKEVHPDMENGSAEKFKKLNEAHKILRKELE